MKLINTLFFILFCLTFSSCYENESTVVQNFELKKIKDSIKKSFNDSIAKSDSIKTVIGIAKLNKKTKVILYDNFNWEYKINQQNKKTKVNEKQIQNLMQTFEPRESEYKSSEVCGALTKKGGRCHRIVKGGGRCWQH